MAAEISGPRLCWFKVYPKAIAHKTNLPGECTLGMEFSSRPLGQCPNPPLVESHHLVKIKKRGDLVLSENGLPCLGGLHGPRQAEGGVRLRQEQADEDQAPR